MNILPKSRQIRALRLCESEKARLICVNLKSVNLMLDSCDCDLNLCEFGTNCVNLVENLVNLVANLTQIARI